MYILALATFISTLRACEVGGTAAIEIVVMKIRG
jgi:hypothetical protein